MDTILRVQVLQNPRLTKRYHKDEDQTAGNKEFVVAALTFGKAYLQAIRCTFWGYLTRVIMACRYHSRA